MKLEETGMSPATVRYYAKKLGIDIINSCISERDLETIKGYKRDSVAQIAREYGYSRQYVHKLMINLGVIEPGVKPDLQLIRDVMEDRKSERKKCN